jgi:predicted ATPase
MQKLRDAGEAEVVRRRHMEWYCDLSEAANANYWVPGLRGWLDRLEGELDNLRSALKWSLTSGEAAVGLRIATALWLFWDVRGYLREARRWFEQLFAADASNFPTVVRATAEAHAG